MRSYRTFIIIFSSLFILYIVIELNKPKPLDWNVTLSKDDKNPYGAYVLYSQLKNLFPNTSIKSFREPPYNVLSDSNQTNNAYLFLSPQIGTGKEDAKRLLRFVEKGNFVFASTYSFDDKLFDTLGFKIARSLDIADTDSSSINFVNHSLRAANNYTFKRLTIDEYFSELNKKDSTIILGVNQNNKPNFIKVNCGKGAFFIHAAPLCFSNYFMLFHNNDQYVSKALSYLPSAIDNIYWDEYFKLGRDEPQTPLRFLLSNEYLLWALRITLLIMIVFILFDMKRRQRIIPVIEPLRNTSLDFIKTVSSVYYNQHDNKNIAEKKFSYWFEFIRQRYFLSTQNPDEEFEKQLQRKSGAPENLIKTITAYFHQLQTAEKISDDELLHINQSIDSFYQL